jgi:hypothetical protein
MPSSFRPTLGSYRGDRCAKVVVSSATIASCVLLLLMFAVVVFSCKSWFLQLAATACLSGRPVSVEVEPDIFCSARVAVPPRGRNDARTVETVGTVGTAAGWCGITVHRWTSTTSTCRRYCLTVSYQTRVGLLCRNFNIFDFDWPWNTQRTKPGQVHVSNDKFSINNRVRSTSARKHSSGRRQVARAADRKRVASQ